MASQKSLILREAAARQRSQKAIGHLRVEGVNIPELVTTNRDVQVARVQELEYFADVMERFAQMHGGQSQLQEEAAGEQTDEATQEEATEGAASADVTNDEPEPAGKATKATATRKTRK